MCKIIRTILVGLFSLVTIQTSFGFIEGNSGLFVPQNQLEREVKGWLEKTLREFSYYDVRDPDHHFYLFNILQDALFRLPLERRRLLLHSQNKAGCNFFHQVILKSADQERCIMLLRILIFAGVDIKRKTAQKETALTLAYKKKAPKIIAFLNAQKSRVK